MKAGWVIAKPSGEDWDFTLVSPSGETEHHTGTEPARAVELLSGGARIGLVCGHEGAPLVALPCAPCQALRGLQDGGNWMIVPRFSQASPMMLSAGEEVTLAGAMAIAPKFDGCILIRGAGRSLWAQVSAGEVISITASAMPGLRAILAPGDLAPGDLADTTGLSAAAADTLSRPERLSTFIASTPALRRLRNMGDRQIGTLVAGWCLGAELAATKAWWLGQPILLISDQADGADMVLEAQGISLHRLPPGAALLAGLKEIAPL